MLTSIEIDGFKTFKNFRMDFSPFTVIAGTNASGKSNLFDALMLLARLTETDLKTAFGEQQRGDAIELFTQYPDGSYAEEMSFKADLLINQDVRDNWGGETRLKYTRLRYELKVGRRRSMRGINELLVIDESLVHIRSDNDTWVKTFISKKNLSNWRPKVLTGKRSIPYIKTEIKNDTPTIVVPQDGRTGNKREYPVSNIVQTVLSGFNSIDFPHIFAAREEIRSWRLLQLNPESLRKPSPYLTNAVLSSDGGNLAAVLQRIKSDDETLLRDIARKLTNLLPNLIDIDVYNDEANKQFIIRVKSEDGREFSSKVLSEGTLRLLALCVFQFDDDFRGLICYEEPENGIHPFRIRAIVKLLQDLSVNFSEPDTPLRQVIVNTHSPVLVGETFELKEKEDLKEQESVTVWFSQLVSQVIEGSFGKRRIFVTKMLPVVKGNKQLSIKFSENERRLTLLQLTEYLKNADFEQVVDTLKP